MTSKVILLPISTRSVGFTIRCLVKQIRRLLESKYKDLDWYHLTNALYRVTLLKLHIKINRSFRHSFVNHNTSDQPYFPPEELDISIKYKWKEFKVIHQLLSAIGYMQYKGDRFMPILPLLKAGQNCDPINVRFTNLRQIVTSLADPETSIETRRHFWEYNPIPGAKWSTVNVDGKEEFIATTYLTNPNDIMPEKYEWSELDSDISVIENCLAVVNRKHIAQERIEYDSNGSVAQFVSSIPKAIRCPSYIDNQKVLPLGDYSEFWSPRWLKPKQIDLGVICLFGEHSAAIENERLLAIRYEEVATQYIDQNYWPVQPTF